MDLLADQTSFIIGENASINEALHDLLPSDLNCKIYTLKHQSKDLSSINQELQNAKIAVVDLSEMIDSKLNLIENLLNINPELKILCLNEYLQYDYADKLLKKGAKSYIPIHSFPSEYQNAFNHFEKNETYVSKFVQKF